MVQKYLKKNSTCIAETRNLKLANQVKIMYNFCIQFTVVMTTGATSQGQSSLSVAVFNRETLLLSWLPYYIGPNTILQSLNLLEACRALLFFSSSTDCANVLSSYLVCICLFVSLSDGLGLTPSCPLSGPSCPQRPAGSWASPVTCCAAAVSCSGSLAWPSCSPIARGAASRRPSWTGASSIQEPSLKSVDENWGGSRKSKLL